MKVSLFLSSFWLLIASLFTKNEMATLSGTVTDGKEPLIGVTIMIQKNRAFVKGAITDVNGQYRLELEPGTYDVEFSYTGFVSQRLADVNLVAGKPNTLDLVMKPSGHTLDEVVVTDIRTHGKTKARSAAFGAPSTTGADKMAPSEAPLGHASPTPAVAMKKKSADGWAKPMKDAPPPSPMREKAPPKAVLKGHAEPAEMATEELHAADDMEFGETEKPYPTAQPAPRAGLLTAGEWNDLHNWNRHWVDLLGDGETDAYQKTYGFFPRQRYTLLATNDNGFPIADAVAQLKNADGKTLWETRTDNTGKAELWADLFAPAAEPNAPRAELWVDGRKHEIKNPKPAASGFNYLKISAECFAPKNVDIVWAVDATGSMGDEIEYLKTELLDVIGRAQSRNHELAFRMGTVFYRDKGDDYITRSSGLSPDIAKTVEFIRAQSAGGGGDYPEAVHSALEEAIYGQKWSESAVARICFLVLDASPHQNPEVVASLQKSIREAARLGIRIVPLTASGIQKDTEFLMKFFGLATNGTYVFLTDHSGIGGKHLEPTTDEYKVEPLNNLLVRLIGEYTSLETCEGKSEIRFENDPQQQPGPMLRALYYPNPATDQFTLELPLAVQSVTIYDSEGKAVRKLENPQAGPNQVMVNDFPAGFYTIRILNNGLMQSGKLMVVRS